MSVTKCSNTNMEAQDLEPWLSISLSLIVQNDPTETRCKERVVAGWSVERIHGSNAIPRKYVIALTVITQKARNLISNVSTTNAGAVSGIGRR